MTTTQTRPPANRPPRRDRDPVPESMRKYRATVTAVMLLLFAGSVLAIAFFKGLGKPLLVPVALTALAVVLVIVAQLPVVYRWNDRPPKVKAVKPAEAPAPARAAGPVVKPAPSLGTDFGYIVGFVRHLAAHDRGDIFAEMQGFYEWVAQQGDDHPYVESAERVWTLAKTLRSYAEVDDKKIVNGDFNPGNPMPFLVELEDIQFVAATVAAYMLVRRNSEIDEADQIAVMEPWVKLHLPYRVGDVTYQWDSQAGRYGIKRSAVPPSQRTTTIPGLVGIPGSEPPVEDLNTVIALRRAEQVPARPAPVEQTPQPGPPPADSAADDVPTWTKEELAHAAELVITSQLGSLAMLQRKMRITSALATKIMFQLNLLGIVGPYAGANNRDVLVPASELDDVLEFIESGGR